MKKFLRRIMTLYMAAVMVLLPASGTFAKTGTTTPSASDTQTVYVYNIEKGVTVMAYQILSAVYDSKGNGLTGYEIASAISGYSLTLESPTNDEISAIASGIYDGEITGLTSVNLTRDYDYTETDGGDDVRYTASLTAGMWIVLVYDSGVYTYMPMIVSNWYTDANDASSLTAGYVDADGYFVEAEWSDSSDDTVSNRTYTENASVVYAKRSLITVDKSITNYTVDTTYGTETAEGAAYNAGDTVSFEIETTMPDYSDAYINSKYTVVYTVTDTLAAGFDQVDEDTICVSVGGTVYKASYVDSATALTVYNYVFEHTVNDDGSQILEFAFTQNFIDEHPNESIVITYDAVLNTSAALTGDDEAVPNTNNVMITATNDPDSEDYIYLYDDVYVYSFSLTDELVKVMPEGSASANGNTVTAVNALDDAEFTIYTDAECTTPYMNSFYNDLTDDSENCYTAVSDENGYISFNGLAEGTYYITETEAPDDYMINDTVYQIVITASYDETEGSSTEGLLMSYTVIVTDLENGSTYTNTYEISYSMEKIEKTYTDSNDSGNTITYTRYELDESKVNAITVSASQNPAAIVDPDLIKLPSTGGMGIYVLMAISFGMMAAAGYAAFRKKDHTA